jgi:hypothetical protein
MAEIIKTVKHQVDILENVFMDYEAFMDDCTVNRSS